MKLFELVAYHGAPTHGKGFAVSHKGDNASTFSDYTSKRYGSFFSDNPKFSDLYGKTQEYNLDITNPYDFRKHGNWILDRFIQYAETVSDAYWQKIRFYIVHQHRTMWELFEEEFGKEFVKYLVKEGYDSAIFAESNTDDDDNEIESNTIVVFDPSNIEHKGQRNLPLHNVEKEIEHH